MAHPLEAVLVLQDKDRKIAKLKREIRDIPARKSDIETQLEGAKQRLAAAHNQQMQQTADLKQIEIDVESHREKIIKYKQQQMEAKTNEQYRALLNQIAAEERAISASEDREIALMDQIDASKKLVAQCETDLQTEQAAIAEELEMLDERMAEAREDLQAMIITRSRLAGEIAPALLSRYDRLFKNKGDFAVVEVEEAHCGGCRMKLPPQVVNDALNPAKLAVCNFCGRMLINRR